MGAGGMGDRAMRADLARVLVCWPPRRCSSALAACGEQPPCGSACSRTAPGPSARYEDAELSGAELPLIERGAQPRGRRASDGSRRGRGRGPRVELVGGCTESRVHDPDRRAAPARRGRARRRIVAGTIGSRRARVYASRAALPARAVHRRLAGARAGDAAAPRREPLSLRHRRRLRTWPGSRPMRTASSAGAGLRSSHDTGRRLGRRDSLHRGVLRARRGVTATSCPTIDLSSIPKGRDVDASRGTPTASRCSGRGSSCRPTLLRASRARRRRLAAHRRRARDLDDPTRSSRSPARLAGVVGASLSIPPASASTCAALRRTTFPGISAGPPGRHQGGARFHDGVEALLRGIERSGGDTRTLPAALARAATSTCSAAPCGSTERARPSVTTNSSASNRSRRTSRR